MLFHRPLQAVSGLFQDLQRFGGYMLRVSMRGVDEQSRGFH
ncbi:hypothetical protein [Paenibacillus sp. URB8-2]